MSLTDLVIPPWVRIAACAAVVGLIFGAGYHAGGWVSDCRNAAKVSAAEHEQHKAQTERDKARIETEQAKRATKELQASVDLAAGVQAQKTAQTIQNQTEVTNKAVTDYAQARDSVEHRIADGRLRSNAVRSGRVSGASSSAGRSDPGTAQSMPADAGGNGAEVSGAVENAVRENAARDTVMCERLVQWACDQGMCP